MTIECKDDMRFYVKVKCCLYCTARFRLNSFMSADLGEESLRNKSDQEIVQMTAQLHQEARVLGEAHAKTDEQLRIATEDFRKKMPNISVRKRMNSKLDSPLKPRTVQPLTWSNSTTS